MNFRTPGLTPRFPAANFQLLGAKRGSVSGKPVFRNIAEGG